ncbi:uncharacterized protein, partial [Cherax quadricarinatus]|uniref:uncharacterized protein n=1 Tax=Cherax quadricarinatus TaxID=27406 RepID=UPI00387E832A
LRGSTLVIGDLNARHQFWEPSISLGSVNPTGRALFQTLLASRLSLLMPPGLETRVDPYTGRVSTLDLVLGCGYFTTATVTVGPFMGSDHLSVLTSTNEALEVPVMAVRSRWKITQAVKARQTVWTRWWRQPSRTQQLAYRRADALCRQTLLQAKRASWALFCSSLSFRTSASQAWGFFHSMLGSRSVSTFSLLGEGATPLLPQDKAETFSNFFGPMFSPPPPPPLPSKVIKWGPLPPAIPEVHCQVLASPFSSHELQRALSQLSSSSSPGEDNLPYSFILHLPPSCTEAMLEVFNTSWYTGVFPDMWKHSSDSDSKAGQG